MTSLHQRVRRTIRRHGLCPQGSRVVAALSGGSDSVALTSLLRDLAAPLGFVLAGVAHLNHQLRETAARDEAFCRALAERFGVPIVVGHADVSALARTEGRSLEHAARCARYAFLADAALQLDALRIAVGHTLDDQAETFVLKLVRGAGLTGLGAIYPVRDRIVRPLLDVTRDELRAYLTALGQDWVEDETNADVSNPRNRVRHEVLPYLERALGLPARRAMARAAGLAAEDARWLDELASERLARLSRDTAAGFELDAAALRTEPPPLARRIILVALRARAGGREIGLEHVQSVQDVLAGFAAGVEVPGVRVELRGEKLVLLR